MILLRNSSRKSREGQLRFAARRIRTFRPLQYQLSAGQRWRAVARSASSTGEASGAVWPIVHSPCLLVITHSAVQSGCTRNGHRPQRKPNLLAATASPDANVEWLDFAKSARPYSTWLSHVGFLKKASSISLPSSETMKRTVEIDGVCHSQEHAAMGRGSREQVPAPSSPVIEECFGAGTAPTGSVKPSRTYIPCLAR